MLVHILIEDMVVDMLSIELFRERIMAIGLWKL